MTTRWMSLGRWSSSGLGAARWRRGHDSVSVDSAQAIDQATLTGGEGNDLVVLLGEQSVGQATLLGGGGDDVIDSTLFGGGDATSTPAAVRIGSRRARRRRPLCRDARHRRRHASPARARHVARPSGSPISRLATMATGSICSAISTPFSPAGTRSPTPSPAAICGWCKAAPIRSCKSIATAPVRPLFETLITLQNVATALLTTLNLGDLPQDGSKPAGRTILGDGFGNAFWGTLGNDTILGLGGNDRLEAYAGDDVIDGGHGSDTMIGGAGDDVYFVDNAGDVVIELAGQGFDIVYARVSYVLSAGASFEVLATIDNTATTALNLTGNELANYVTGNAGANMLDGGAGGADQLWGRGGDDSYYADVGDDVVEYEGDGYDIVYARSSYRARSSGMAVEVLATIDNTGDDGDQPQRQCARQLHRRQCRGEHAGRRRRRRPALGPGGRRQLHRRHERHRHRICRPGQRHPLCQGQITSLAAGLSIETLATADNTGDHGDRPRPATSWTITSPAMPGRTCSTAAPARTCSGAGRATTAISPTATTLCCEDAGAGQRHHLRPRPASCSARASRSRSSPRSTIRLDHGAQPDRQRAGQLCDRQCRREHPRRRRRRGPIVRPGRRRHLRLHHRARRRQCRYDPRLPLGHRQDRARRRALRRDRRAGQLQSPTPSSPARPRTTPTTGSSTIRPPASSSSMPTAAAAGAARCCSPPSAGAPASPPADFQVI